MSINDPNDANALGIGMVHQHFKLVECFSVLDNIILGVETTKGGLLKKMQRERKSWIFLKNMSFSRPRRFDRRYHSRYAAENGDFKDAVSRQRDFNF